MVKIESTQLVVEIHLESNGIMSYSADKFRNSSGMRERGGM